MFLCRWLDRNPDFPPSLSISLCKCVCVCIVLIIVAVAAAAAMMPMKFCAWPDHSQIAGVLAYAHCAYNFRNNDNNKNIDGGFVSKNVHFTQTRAQEAVEIVLLVFFVFVAAGWWSCASAHVLCTMMMLPFYFFPFDFLESLLLRSLGERPHTHTNFSIDFAFCAFSCRIAHSTAPILRCWFCCNCNSICRRKWT